MAETNRQPESQSDIAVLSSPGLSNEQSAFSQALGSDATTQCNTKVSVVLFIKSFRFLRHGKATLLLTAALKNSSDFLDLKAAQHTQRKGICFRLVASFDKSWTSWTPAVQCSFRIPHCMDICTGRTRTSGRKRIILLMAETLSPIVPVGNGYTNENMAWLITLRRFDTI